MFAFFCLPLSTFLFHVQYGAWKTTHGCSRKAFLVVYRGKAELGLPWIFRGTHGKLLRPIALLYSQHFAINSGQVSYLVPTGFASFGKGVQIISPLMLKIKQISWLCSMLARPWGKVSKVGLRLSRWRSLNVSKSPRAISPLYSQPPCI